MSDIDKLTGIRAKCVELLKVAEKRTPGKWEVTAGVYDYSSEATQFPECPSIRLKGDYDMLFGLGQERDAAFIASCAGNAEAGWRSTVAVIDLYNQIHRHYGPVNQMLYAFLNEAISEILTAWEGVV